MSSDTLIRVAILSFWPAVCPDICPVDGSGTEFPLMAIYLPFSQSK
jgi:hypothetical protein